MPQVELMYGALRKSGRLVIAGLIVEALCLMWSRPIAFVVFMCLGGALIGLGVLFFLYSLVSASPQALESSNAAREKL
jgi:RsiW-degrading membrane proteinase PrsW (M82 family)